MDQETLTRWVSLGMAGYWIARFMYDTVETVLQRAVSAICDRWLPDLYAQDFQDMEDLERENRRLRGQLDRMERERVDALTVGERRG